MTAISMVRARIGRNKFFAVDDERFEDFGAIYAHSGLHLTPVRGHPSVGQYAICRGAYIFADAEDGRKAVILYFHVP